VANGTQAVALGILVASHFGVIFSCNFFRQYLLSKLPYLNRLLWRNMAFDSV
jgi:hypothetical protein